jgi:hypothetical protein
LVQWPTTTKSSFPEYLEEGVYANSVRLWNTRTEFTLDFLASPTDQAAPDVARVVSRVKIPTMFMFRLIQQLNGNMTDYEEKYGEIK